jgi:hypothetical protein
MRAADANDRADPQRYAEPGGGCGALAEEHAGEHRDDGRQHRGHRRDDVDRRDGHEAVHDDDPDQPGRAAGQPEDDGPGIEVPREQRQHRRHQDGADRVAQQQDGDRRMTSRGDAPGEVTDPVEDGGGQAEDDGHT